MNVHKAHNNNSADLTCIKTCRNEQIKYTSVWCKHQCKHRALWSMQSHTSTQEWMWGSHSIVYGFIIACVLGNGISSLTEALWVGGGFALQSVSIHRLPLSFIFPPFLSSFLSAGVKVHASTTSILSSFHQAFSEAQKSHRFFPFCESLHVPYPPLHPYDFSCFRGCFFPVQRCGVFPVSVCVWLDSVSVSALFNQHVNKKGN